MQVFQTYQPSYRSDQSFVHGNPIADLITQDFIKQNYLAGLPLTATINGQSLESIIQQKIDAAVGEFETKLDTFVVPRVILSCVVGQTPQLITNLSTKENPSGMVSGTPAVAGTDYDLLEPPYDYTTRRFENWGLIKTKHRPVIDVANIIYALPPNFGILVVPPQWITVNPNSGIIRIVPVEGAMAVTSPGAGMWLPFFTMGTMSRVPQFTQVTYTSGISPIPTDMVDAISALATSRVLEVYDNAYYPGMQSFVHSVDGFNQNVTLKADGPFVKAMQRFEARAYKYIASWRESHNGIRFASLGR